MPADEFRTELRDSLTNFYKKILQRAGAGGRPVAKKELMTRANVGDGLGGDERQWLVVGFRDEGELSVQEGCDGQVLGRGNLKAAIPSPL